MKLSLDALQILDAIDRRGSFAAAGKALHKVPSTISYTVGRLEEDLGVRVFERQGPKATLTAAGRELLAEGRHLLRAAIDLELRVKKVSAGWETSLAIGLDSLFDPAALAADLRDFYAVTRHTRLRVVQDALTGTWEALLDRRVDVLIGAAGDGPSGGGHLCEPFGTLSFVFAVAPSHPLAKLRRRLTNADLQQHRAIVVADSARKLIPRTVGVLAGQDALTVPDMRAKIAMQKAGVGFGFLPEPFVRAAVKRRELVIRDVDEPKPAETFHLAWRTGETGAAQQWWLDRARSRGMFERLLALTLKT
ncbi:MAG TPA: LysR family transcriptional regulator [Tahibacter sp.]|uniref:LysR family transcriptional regulator n=1 Tax=Tahibacter sp. TaxID=2056211 RepID=UPI002CBBDDFB|nr:LysR family transcriptional regulator [Tahibacter sp.]HSX61509.1 LysR family transcriptional regulator [Tahibacter sp.]